MVQGQGSEGPQRGSQDEIDGIFQRAHQAEERESSALQEVSPAVEAPMRGGDSDLIQSCIIPFMQTLRTSQDQQRYLTVLNAFRDDFDNHMPRDPEVVVQWLRELRPASKLKEKLGVITRRDYYQRLRAFWNWARENWPPFSDLGIFPQPYEKFGKRKGNGRAR